jgi:hypothetical protein
MKTKLTKPIMAAALLLCALLVFKFKSKSEQSVEKNSKTFLTVSDAKEKAYQQQEPEQIINLKGIYTVQQKSGAGNLLLLEDAEPTGMEDIPLYCIFSPESTSYLSELEAGTELVVSGKLYRKNNSVEVADCKIICINKGTIEPAGFSFAE